MVLRTSVIRDFFRCCVYLWPFHFLSFGCSILSLVICWGIKRDLSSAGKGEIDLVSLTARTNQRRFQGKSFVATKFLNVKPSYCYSVCTWNIRSKRNNIFELQLFSCPFPRFSFWHKRTVRILRRFFLNQLIILKVIQLSPICQAVLFLDICPKYVLAPGEILDSHPWWLTLFDIITTEILEKILGILISYLT